MNLVAKLKGRYKHIATFVVVVAIVSAANVLLLSATPSSYFEAEQGQLSSGATLITDSNASGGQAIGFGQAQGSCGYDEKLVPKCGMWLGGWGNDYLSTSWDWRNNVLDHEARIGRQLDVVRYYHGPTGPPLSNSYTGNMERFFLNRSNTLLLLNWKPAEPWSNGGGNNATTNSYIDQAADNIKAIAPKKIMLIIYHEPENDVSGGTNNCPSNGYASSASSGTPAEYRAMWQNVRNRFDAKGVNNVVWVMNYMGFNRYDCMVKDLWPGNHLVDWVMWNPYFWGNHTWQSEVSRFYNFLNSNSTSTHDFKSKPYGFAEWGSWYDTQAPAYKLYDDAKLHLNLNTFPNLKLISIFDAIGTQDSRIKYSGTTGNVDEEEQLRYRNFVNDPLLKQPHVPIGGAQ